MKKTTLILLWAIFNIAVFYSCNKDNLGEVNRENVFTHTSPNPPTRLKFNSPNEIENLIKQMEETDGNQKKTKASSDFLSLNDYLKKITLDSLSPDELAIVEKEGLVFEPEDEIIADPYFCELLNPKREIEVDGQIYKYVKDGIFRCDTADAELLNEIDEGNLQVPNGIYEEFTTIKGSLEFVSRDFSTTSETVQTKAQSGSRRGDLKLKDGTIINQSDIRDMKYGKKSGDAGWLQKTMSSAFGKNTVVEVNYDKRHRMKLRMYKQNYVIYKAIGMTVRMQKRRLRIWWRTKADEFRFGWKNLELSHTFKSPNPIPPIPVKDKLTGQENLRTPEYIKAKFPFADTESVLFTIPFGSYKSITTGDVNKLFSSAMSLVASHLKQEFKNMSQGAYTTEGKSGETIVYSLIPQQEKIERNTGREVVRFDLKWFDGEFQVGISINSTTGAPAIKSISASPKGGGNIHRGEVYAAVKYDGKWKAARIYTE